MLLRKIGYDLSIKNKDKTPKTALFVGHLGLGDQIWLSGAVRYIARMHEYLHVVCKPQNYATLSLLYSDLPGIQLITVNDGYVVSPTETRKGVCFSVQPGKYSQIYECGFYKKPTSEVNMDDLPGEFYDHLNLPRSIRYSHFSLPDIPQSKFLYDLIRSQPYIFVHTKSSSTTTPIISWDINEILTIDPNINQYSQDHGWYSIAQEFINKQFLYYCDTIKHATELHMTNSSFYTLATQLAPLDAKVKQCYDRDSGKVNNIYDFT